MSVISVGEVHNGRNGTRTITGSDYTRIYNVLTDDVNDTEHEVLTADDLPKMSDSFDLLEAPGIKVYNKKAVQNNENRKKWEVTVKYRTPTINNVDVEDPTQLPPQIIFGGVSYMKVIDSAYKYYYYNASQWFPPGNFTQGVLPAAILNSAFQPFDPPLQQEYNNLLITVVRNEATFDGNNVKIFKNSINKDPITIAGVTLEQYQGRMKEYAATKRWDNAGDYYWEVRYDIEVADGTHVRQVLDQGWYTYDPGTDKHTAIPDSGGNDMNEPSLLDGTGLRLSFGQDPKYMKFITYFPTAWSSLNLPITN